MMTLFLACGIVALVTVVLLLAMTAADWYAVRLPWWVNGLVVLGCVAAPLLCALGVLVGIASVL